ncbi:hypothetical protein QJ857_gp0333 [Tupanvirus soda lake]|uniref:Uncharacterized protein n=2 Tax=Tupanvirus TaxID=2094720 RepID=A0A6N1NWH3_9VIRU|nr:hypothetical protein QJ857_gp0333 [Tupanvirus soda lake]QKU35696.1 hypothetical protein [Tupanvirus soda lake]
MKNIAKTFIVLYFIGIVLVSANDTKDDVKKDNKEKKEELAEKVEKVAAIIGNPKVAAAIEIIKALKTESSSTISERKDQTGFLNIQNNYEYGHGAVLISKMEQLISFWLNDNTYIFLTMEQKNTVSKALTEYTFQIAEDPFYKQKYELSFSDGRGSIFMMVLSFEPHPTNPNAVKWQKHILKSNFVPAPSYVIVTESDCNIFSCDRSDHIVYLPAVLNKGHIEEIVRINMEMLTSFSNSIPMLGS